MTLKLGTTLRPYIAEPRPEQFGALDEHQRSTLRNICMIAAERFEGHQRTFLALVDATPDPDSMMQIHGAGAKRLADQFEVQALEARLFMEALDDLG